MPSFLDLHYVLPVQILSVEPNVLKQRALSGKPFFPRGDAQYWNLLFSTKPIRKKEAKIAEVSGHLMDHNIHTSFNVDFPQHPGLPSATILERIVTSSSASSGVDIIQVMSSVAIIIHGGWFFRLRNQTKIYRVRETANLAPGRPTNLKIFPALVKPIVAQGEDLDFKPDRLKMVSVYAESQPIGVSYVPGGLVQFSFNLEEVVE